MVDLKIWRRLVELQYLREGFWRQFFAMVELKSGGSCRLFRSSTTVAVNAVGIEIVAIAIIIWNLTFLEAMAENRCFGFTRKTKKRYAKQVKFAAVAASYLFS